MAFIPLVDLKPLISSAYRSTDGEPPQPKIIRWAAILLFTTATQ